MDKTVEKEKWENIKDFARNKKPGGSRKNCKYVLTRRFPFIKKRPLTNIEIKIREIRENVQIIMNLYSVVPVVIGSARVIAKIEKLKRRIKNEK